MIEKHHDNASNSRAQSRAAYAQLFLGMATFGSATPVSKIVSVAVPAFVGSLLRVSLGAFVLAPFAWQRRDELRRLTRRHWLLIGLISLFGMFGFSALMLLGMKLIPGVIGAIVMSTTPAVTAAASMVFLSDEITWRKATAIILAVAGILVIYAGGSDGSIGANDGSTLVLGSVLVFAAVCCEAAYTLIGKEVTKTISPVLTAFLAALFALPLFIPFAAWQWGDVMWQNVSWGQWIALVWYGAGTLAFGTWLWYSGVAKVEGSIAAGFMGVMPVSALILSYVLLGESFRWLHVVGFCIVFAGVLLISVEHARMSSNTDHS